MVLIIRFLCARAYVWLPVLHCLDWAATEAAGGRLDVSSHCCYTKVFADAANSQCSFNGKKTAVYCAALIL